MRIGLNLLEYYPLLYVVSLKINLSHPDHGEGWRKFPSSCQTELFNKSKMFFILNIPPLKLITFLNPSVFSLVDSVSNPDVSSPPSRTHWGNAPPADLGATTAATRDFSSSPRCTLCLLCWRLSLSWSTWWWPSSWSTWTIPTRRLRRTPRWMLR